MPRPLSTALRVTLAMGAGLLLSSQKFLPAGQSAGIMQTMQEIRLVSLVPTESVPGEILFLLFAAVPLGLWGWLRFRFWLRRHVR